MKSYPNKKSKEPETNVSRLVDEIYQKIHAIDNLPEGFLRSCRLSLSACMINACIIDHRFKKAALKDICALKDLDKEKLQYNDPVTRILYNQIPASIGTEFPALSKEAAKKMYNLIEHSGENVAEAEEKLISRQMRKEIPYKELFLEIIKEYRYWIRSKLI